MMTVDVIQNVAVRLPNYLIFCTLSLLLATEMVRFEMTTTSVGKNSPFIKALAFITPMNIPKLLLKKEV